MVVYKVEDYTIQLPQSDDLQLWMKMIECVKDNFPGLETLEQLKEYEQAIIKTLTVKLLYVQSLIITLLVFCYFPTSKIAYLVWQDKKVKSTKLFG